MLKCFLKIYLKYIPFNPVLGVRSVRQGENLRKKKFKPYDEGAATRRIFSEDLDGIPHIRDRRLRLRAAKEGIDIEFETSRTSIRPPECASMENFR